MPSSSTTGPAPGAVGDVSYAAHVPAELASSPFLGRSAVADGLLTRHQLLSSAWRRVLRGVYVHDAVWLDDAMRWDAVRLRLGADDVVAGRTAAWAYGVWQPPVGAQVPWEVTARLASSGRDGDLARRRLVLRGTDDCSRAASGDPLQDQDVVLVHGVPVVSPARCCFDLMRERGLVEAVVVADAFFWAGVLDPVALAVYAADRHRWPHVRMVRLALDLTSSWARSPGESRLRMVVVLAGLPEPWVNTAVVDAGGAVLGVPDLTVLGRRGPVGLEYDGRYHQDPDQTEADDARERRLLTASGLPLLRYDAERLLHRRDDVLREVVSATGCRPLNGLLARDFRRPPPALAW